MREDLLDSYTALFLTGVYLPAQPVIGASKAQMKCAVSRIRAINSSGQQGRSVPWAGSKTDGHTDQPSVSAKSSSVDHACSLKPPLFQEGKVPASDGS